MESRSTSRYGPLEFLETFFSMGFSCICDECGGCDECSVKIDTVGERESDAINQNLENKKEEDMTDD